MPVPTVRLKQLDGLWQTVGVDTYRGVHPDNLVLSADMFGSKTASFDLRRDPAVVHQDLSAFTPVKVDVDGVPLWSGRVIETPARDGADRALSVQCEGWQHHLDDDLVESGWVHDRLGAWTDTRGFLAAPLANYTAVTNVQVGTVITLGWPTGTTSAVGQACGVTLDLGPGRTAASLAATIATSSFAAGSFTVYLKGHDDLATVISGGSNAASQDAATLGTFQGDLSGYRYVSIIVYKHSGGTFTETTDRILTVSMARVFAATSYRSGSSSVLKASTVVSGVLDRAAPLLSTDRSGITATSFNIPEYWPDGPRTPREHINAVNAFHGWQFKVDPESRPVFQALPSRPRFTIGDWSACELQDSSQNSGQDIYNRVLVTGQDPAGGQVSVIRGIGSLPEYWAAQSDVSFPNPSFDTNTTGWDTSFGLTRTTTAGEFESGPGGGKTPGSGGSYPNYTNLTGTCKAGQTYIVTFWFRFTTASSSSSLAVNMGDLAGTVPRTVRLATYASGTLNDTNWRQMIAFWTPTEAFQPRLTLSPFVASGSAFLQDSFRILKPGQALPDRRGFVRTKQLSVNSTLPSDGVAAAQLGDAWLANHSTTPFRGTLTITGPNALRDRTSGTPIPPATLLRHTGELIHFADRIDPDTGGVGRDGRIVNVTYRPDLDQAVIELDNSRADFDQLLSRLAVIQGAQ